ncbi:hypothetical protein E2C01_026252 [Portunus trituberculatus]|uniref:Secreted protein n=1 Tax=Portunus trituberculatus TaxID=210409 RepID=A0A5B7EHL5_PORTR|nr:hypothetical protein [Portunus trituberculatus]
MFQPGSSRSHSHCFTTGALVMCTTVFLSSTQDASVLWGHGDLNGSVGPRVAGTEAWSAGTCGALDAVLLLSSGVLPHG